MRGRVSRKIEPGSRYSKFVFLNHSVEGIRVLGRIVILIEVYGYETIRELRSSQRDHEECGGCEKETQGIVSVWSCGGKGRRKKAKVRRKPSASPKEKIGDLKE